MPAYTVGVIKSFVAQHQLVGGDWGKENLRHSHPYKLEAIFEGNELDKHGYLLDIAVVEQHTSQLDERVPSFLERAYLSTAAQLADMFAVGAFPLPDDVTNLAFNPLLDERHILHVVIDRRTALTGAGDHTLRD